MKQKFMIAFAMLISLGANAQTETPDTIEAQTLTEVTIAAPKVIRKADMDVYHPSQSAVENAKNGVQLLNNLMIPQLTVNEALEKITASGESVQLRINGRTCSVKDVKALLPETIKRIEWIDNPGLRYKGASYVLNIIARNPEMGGALMTEAMQSVHSGWGKYFAGAKLNFGRSQFEIMGNAKITANFDTHRLYQETFTYPDGYSFTRKESPLGGALNNSVGDGYLAYSYIKPDTTIFYVSLSANDSFNNYTEFNGIMSRSDNAENIYMKNATDNRGVTPSLSVYLEQHFANNQVFVFDLGSSIYNGYSSSAYLEQDMDKNVLTDVNTYIKDNNKTYAFEADYIKKWDKSSLTLGTSYTARRNKSTYKYLDNSVYHQRNDAVYFFSEYMHRIKYVTLTGGLGATFIDYKFHETGKGNNSWNFTPQFTAVYRPNSVSQFRLALRSWQSAPSLSKTNMTAQQIDGIQWTIGNASLKSSRSYNLALRYSFNLPVITGAVGTNLFSSPDAIAPYMYWENDKLFTSYENSKGLKYVQVWFSPQIELIPKWFYVSGTISYKAENMKGTGYSLYNHTWSGEVTAMLRHKNFAMTVQYRKASRDLFGETVDWGEDFSLVDLRYNLDKWQFGAGCFMPFGKYDQGKVSYNKFYSYEYHLRPDVRFFYVRVAYNLQWGRQKKGVNKMVNANTGTDTSTAASR